MSVEVWYGSKPHHASEQETLVDLFQNLEAQSEHFVVLANFFAGQSNEIDLVILKRQGIFLVELKHVWDPIFGAREGCWKAKQADGSEIMLNADRPNPFKQVQSNYYSWKNWCEAHVEQLTQGQPPGCRTDWSRVMTYIVLYPDLPDGSRIEIGTWPVRAVGLPKFMTALAIRSASKVDLTREQLSLIPELMGLERWEIPRTTENLKNWRPAAFVSLVARGHNLSVSVFRLDERNGAVSVGRDAGNDLVIASPTVSRNHARLYQEQGRWIIRDLESTSGTFISYNGNPADESRVLERDFALKNNSIIRFGAAAYTLLLQPGEPE